MNQLSQLPETQSVLSHQLFTKFQMFMKLAALQAGQAHHGKLFHHLHGHMFHPPLHHGELHQHGPLLLLQMQLLPIVGAKILVELDTG